ncbi:thiol:disulfide interchange protein TlpA [Devosia pacifica]|uniref:Thiol:disulfide interchange protein TlpA n=1 Tax=Devosia pacifica TaxID=1335967 RepID=A0A918S8E6_9HYPH|nr:TlpA disulfide reductase family protein [Devosia pacifica]GHA26079.1 thiol:disulfide interchange protein TlpA [Devosia pacifica]
MLRLALTLGVAIVAVGITSWIFLSNADPVARECPLQIERAEAIDSAATGELAALNGTGEGRGYRSMTFKKPDGSDTSISAFSGKRLLVNFWASWCVPCREEMPELDEIAEKYNSESFMVLPINLDIGESGREKGQAFIAEGGWSNLPFYADNTYEAFERLKTEAVAVGLPATLVLDEGGCELAVLQGPAKWAHADGEAVIEAVLAQ